MVVLTFGRVQEDEQHALDGPSVCTPDQRSVFTTKQGMDKTDDFAGTV